MSLPAGVFGEPVSNPPDDGITRVQFTASSLLLASSWDATLRLYNPLTNGLLKTCPLGSPVLDCCTHEVGGTFAGTLEGSVKRLEVGQPEQQRVSNLKYQTRCIACYPNGLGYALGSVEGRVAMEYFDLSPDAQGQHYAFKCHRRTEAGQESVFPVNAIGFHPLLGTFATGGADGVVNIWDGDNKKRLHQINRYPTSVASLCFNNDGTMMAVASSYTFEQGEVDQPPDNIYVRRMQETEVKPKPKVFT